MKLFNIRYECNDARDDFSRQLKKGIQSDGVFPQWFSSDMMDELDDNLNYNQGDDFVNFNENDPSNHIKYIELGKKGMTKMNQMQEIDEKMKATDWFDRNSEYLSTSNISPIRPAQ